MWLESSKEDSKEHQSEQDLNKEKAKCDATSLQISVILEDWWISEAVAPFSPFILYDIKFCYTSIDDGEIAT